tara:strand:- start:322 stop:924 length:603 start_codon:yes stop_codon:yes gene_type:complete
VIANLSKQQKDILTGLILGDGHLEFNGCRGTRLQVKQAESRKEYVWWLFENFRQYTKTPPQQRKDTGQWYFGTRFYEDFEEIRQNFYQDKEKIVPNNIEQILNSPISLAVWFMDDGHLDYRERSHHAYHISTDSFRVEDVDKLQQLLLNRFNIKAKTYLSLCRGKRYPKIYIGKEGRKTFEKTILPFILPCFRYKLPPTL